MKESDKRAFRDALGVMGIITALLVVGGVFAAATLALAKVTGPLFAIFALCAVVVVGSGIIVFFVSR